MSSFHRRRRQLEFTLLQEEGEAATLDVRDETGSSMDSAMLGDLFGIAGVGEVSTVNGHAGTVVLDKADIGLPNANNTSDAAKPVSTAQQAALDLKATKIETVAYVDDFNAKGDGATDDTAAIRAAAATGASRLVFRPGGNYLVSSVTEGSTLLSFVGRTGITIDAAESKITNSSSYVLDTLTSMFSFDACKNIKVLLGEYVGLALTTPTTELGYKGATVARVFRGCDGFKIDAKITNARYGVQSGDYADPTLGYNRNFDIRLRTSFCGYPVALYLAEVVKYQVDADDCHRAVYLAGCQDVKGSASWKDLYIAPFATLITDAKTGAGTSRGSSNIDVASIDKGSTVFINTTACAAIALSRVDPGIIHENIKIAVFTKSTDTISSRVGGFSLISSGAAALTTPPAAYGWYPSIIIRNVTVSGVIDHSAQTTQGNTTGDLFVRTYDTLEAQAATVENINFENLIIKQSPGNTRQLWFECPGLVNGGASFRNFSAPGATLVLMTNATAPTRFASSTLGELYVDSTGPSIIDAVDSNITTLTQATANNATVHSANSIVGTISGFVLPAGKTVTTAGVVVPAVTKTTAYTLTGSDNKVNANAASGAFTLTLPSAVGLTGRSFTITRINSGANVVTIATTSSQTIDGITTYVIGSQYGTVEVISDGANWQTIVKEYSSLSGYGMERVFPFAFSTAANEKADIYFTGSQWTALEVTVVGLYNGANATGVLKATYSLGGSSTGTIHSSTMQYDAVLGPVADHFALMPLAWDATNSRWKITVAHRTLNTNTISVRVRWLSNIPTYSNSVRDSIGASAIYTTDTTVAVSPVSEASTLAALKVAKGELVANVKDYGATGDGTTDDTSAIRAAAATGASRLFFPAGGTYKVSSVADGSSLLTFTGRSGITIDAAEATISNPTSYTSDSITAMFLFDGCTNVRVRIGSYVGYTLPTPTSYLGYRGTTLVRAINGCDGVDVEASITNARYGIQSGEYADATKGYNRNIKAKLRTSFVGYPLALYLAEGVRYEVDADDVHRVAYLAGCIDVRGVGKWKNQYIADICTLITDAKTGTGTSRGCQDIDVVSIDKGSTIFQASSMCAGIALSRVDPGIVYENIKVIVRSTSTDTISSTVGGFTITSGAKALTSPVADYNWEPTIVLRNITIGGVLDHSAQTTEGNTAGDIFVRTYDTLVAHSATIENLSYENLIIKQSSGNTRALYLEAPGIINGGVNFRNVQAHNAKLIVLTNTTIPTMFTNCTFKELNTIGVTGGSRVKLVGSTVGSWTGTTSTNDNTEIVSSKVAGAGAFIKHRQVVLDLIGATTSWSAAIPANVIVLGVTAVIAETVTGATGIQVGVAGDPARYLNTSTLTLDTQLTPSSRAVTEQGIWWSPNSTTTLVVTALGSSFTDGQLRIAVTYIELTAPTN